MVDCVVFLITQTKTEANQSELRPMHKLYCALLIIKYLNGLKHASNSQLRATHKFHFVANTLQVKSIAVRFQQLPTE